MTDVQSRYTQLGRLVETFPADLFDHYRLGAGTLHWLGQVYALAAASDPIDGVRLQGAMDRAVSRVGPANYHLRAAAVAEIEAALYRHLAVAELSAPAPQSGAFLPVGSPLTAMAAFGKIAKGAKAKLMIVDPYMDDKALTDFASTAPDSVEIHLLADCRAVKPSLAPAVRRWTAQYGSGRPVEVRLATEGALHDRLVIIDDDGVWSITQSLNAIATRSPASIVRIDGEVRGDKLAHYQKLWIEAAPA